MFKVIKTGTKELTVTGNGFIRGNLWRIDMNILNAMFRTACRFDSWSAYYSFSNDVSGYIRAIRSANSNEQQEQIRKAMMVRLDRSHF